MDPSDENHCESTRPRLRAEQLAAFAAESQNQSLKRTASDIPGLETPQASRPMLALEKSRHRPNGPELAPQQQPDCSPAPLIPLSPSVASPSSSHAGEVSVPQQHLQPPSSPAGVSQPAIDPRPLLRVNTISPTKMAQPPSVTSLPRLSASATPLPRLHPLPPPTAPLPGFQTITTPITLLSYSQVSEGAKIINQALRTEITEEPAGEMSPIWERKLAAEVQKARDETRRSVEQTLASNMQLMIHKAMADGRSEGKVGMQAKLDEAEERVEAMRKKLDPAKVKAAYNRGVRDGGIAGYNKYSLNPETKPSDDRLAFEQILQEKDKTIKSQQRELNERQHRIEHLERQANVPTSQHPSPQQGQHLSNEQIQNAQNQFHAHSQELVNVKCQNEQMRADLNNWQVQWGLITTDLAKWQNGCSLKSEQLSTCQRQLDQSISNLGQSMRELEESKEEGERKTGKLSHFQNQLKQKAEELGNYQLQLERQSAELEKAGTLAIEQAAAIKRQGAEIHRLNLRLEGVQIQKCQTSSPPKPIIDEAEISEASILKDDLARTEAQLNAAQMEIVVLHEKRIKTVQYCSAIKREARQMKTSLQIGTTKNSGLEVEVNRLASKLQEVKTQLEQKDVALATASGEYLKLQKTHNDVVTLCQQLASDLESKQNELDRAIGKMVDLRALERKVDGLNSLIEGLERQKSSLLADLPEVGGFILTGNRGWRTTQRQVGMQRPTREPPSAASLQEDKESKKDDPKEAISEEEAMFRFLHIPLVEGKAILTNLEKSERPSKEAPALIAAELIGAPVQIIKNIIGSMRFRPDHPNSKQLIAAGLLELPEDIVNKILTNREGTIAALSKPPQGPIDRMTKRCRCGGQKAAETPSVKRGRFNRGRLWVASCTLIGCLSLYASYRQANL